MKRGTVTLIALAAVALAGCIGEPAAEPEAVAVIETAPVDPISLVKNGKMPLEGVLTGGQPTDEQFVALRDAGYATVINLRQPDERGVPGEAERIAELGMTYVSIPVAGKDGLNEENAATLAAALEEADYPVLLHCGSGNRVGALLALKAFWLEGASAEQAMELGLAGGVTRLEPVVRELLGLTE
jgi:uncharacterized protein (TIGR01244 family)